MTHDQATNNADLNASNQSPLLHMPILTPPTNLNTMTHADFDLKGIGVVCNLIYIKARTLMEIFPPMLRKLWKDWELRVLVLLSLTLQIVLIFFGNRRKYTRRTWIRIVLWCAYMIADWVAIVALGIISNNHGDVIESNGIDGLPNDGIQLTAFWAPFLLLHLGGPDTVTSYSMEDNELWLRHLLGLDMGLSSASTEHFRESMLTPPDPSPNYSKFMQEYNLKQYEGYHVRAEKEIEAQVVNLPTTNGNNPIRDATELVCSYHLFKTFRLPFVDLILSLDDRENSQSLFKEISWDKRWNLASFIQKLNHSNIDLILTFLLLAVAILLELYAFLLLLSSDWTDLWLSKHANTSIHGSITCLQLPKQCKQPRWSNSMLQFNLFSFSLKEKHSVFYGIQKLLRIDGVIEKHRYTTCEEVHEDLKKFIFDHLKEKFNLLKETSNDAIDIRTLCSYRGDAALEKFNRRCLNWSVEVEFDQSILIWHIATDLCYHLDCRDQDNSMSKCELSKWLSQYMLYILVKCPLMLPRGIGMIRFRDTCAEITQFFKERESRADTVESYSDWFQNACSWGVDFFQTGKPTLDKSHMCKMMLLKMNTQVPPNKVKGDRSKTVLFDACRLASNLQAISDRNQKWEMVSNVWVEMLANAACHCRGNYHAQQLKQGGELLTHVWLLMAHFGLTEQFQISQGAARAKLVVA
ncbi:hypothetical protein ACB094_05G012200 [Castanea mollissima]